MLIFAFSETVERKLQVEGSCDAQDAHNHGKRSPESYLVRTADLLSTSPLSHEGNVCDRFPDYDYYWRPPSASQGLYLQFAVMSIFALSLVTITHMRNASPNMVI